MPKREYCNELCTKPTKGTCKLCDAGRFIWRWLRGLWLGFWADLTGPLGYRVCALIIGAYVGLFAVMEARHERQMNRALYERSTFITMVSSGNRGAFIAAMMGFGPVQTISVFSEPFPLKPWTWLKKERPNMLPLRRWATARLPSCIADECGHSKKDKSYRVDLRQANLQSAELQGVDLSKSDLTGADLRKVNLRWADLREARLRLSNLSGSDLKPAFLQKANLERANLGEADLQNAGLREADLRNAGLRGADLRNADLREANLSNTELQGADLRKADLQDANLQDAKLWGISPGRWIVREYDVEYRAWKHVELLFEAPQTTNLANVKNWTAEQFSST